MSLPDYTHISWLNDLTNFTLAADVPVESAYPLTNCQNTVANEWTVLDMTGKTTAAITFSDAFARAANCFAVHNHDAPDGTTCRLRLYAGEDQTGAVVFDSNDHAVYGATDMQHNIPLGSMMAGVEGIEDNEELSGLKTHYSQWFDVVHYKSGQIDFTNAGGFTDDALKIDKLWLGFAYRFRLGPGWGIDFTLDDDSEHRRKPGGGTETVPGVVRRMVRMDFEFVSNLERATVARNLARAKKGGDLLVTLDPNDARNWSYQTTSIYKRTNNQSFIAKFFNANSFGLALEEN